MSDRVVLITGAKGGLGSFVTQRFLATGATVVGASRGISRPDFPLPNFFALPVDFTKSAAVNTAIGFVIDRYRRLELRVHALAAFAGGQSLREPESAPWERKRGRDSTSTY